MDREPNQLEVLSLPPEQVELALARIENSRAFRSSARHRALLRHMVSRVLNDDQAALKETVLAVEVFGRSAANFDPRVDTIVRVEARRLRARLSDYYRADGRDAPIRIELPVGSYVPLIATRQPPQHEPLATRRARDLIERGEHYLRQPLTHETLKLALERFDLALRESPGSAAALVGMGRAWLNLATGWYVPPAIASEHAGEALRSALALEPDHAVAQVLLAAIQHQFEHDWPGAERGFRRAVAIAPQTAFVHSAYGCHLYMHGAFEESERELALARRLDPMYINTRNHMVSLRLAQRRFDAALAEVDAIADLAPDTMSTAGLRGVIEMCRGNADAAVLHYEQACRALPGHAACIVALAGAHALAGRTAQADALVADALARFDPAGISPYVLAIYETRRGRPDAAFAQLERAVLERDPSAVQAPREPSFDALHGDPRWPGALAEAPGGAAAARLVLAGLPDWGVAARLGREPRRLRHRDRRAVAPGRLARARLDRRGDRVPRRAAARAAARERHRASDRIDQRGERADQPRVRRVPPVEPPAAGRDRRAAGVAAARLGL